jgi:hypothetical protein
VWDYDLGFVKRGLAGEILEWFVDGEKNTYADVSKAGEVVLFAAYLSYALFASAIVWAKPKPEVFLIAISGAVLQPALPALSYDFGRLDQINLAIFFCFCLAVALGEKWVAGMLIAAGSCVAILVHEAFLIMNLPLGAALLAVRLRTSDGLPVRKIALVLCAVLSAPIAAFGAVWFAGSAPVPHNVWRDYWTNEIGFSNRLTEYALNMHYRGIAENVAETISEVGFKLSFVSIAVLISAVGLAIPLWHRFLPQRLWWEKTACFAAALSPLPMFLLGFDYLRWSSMIVTNLLAATLVLAALGRHVSSRGEGRPRLSFGGSRFPFQPAALGLLYIFLAFPQSTGVSGIRIPDEFRCFHANSWSPFLREKVLGEWGCTDRSGRLTSWRSLAKQRSDRRRLSTARLRAGLLDS